MTQPTDDLSTLSISELRERFAETASKIGPSFPAHSRDWLSLRTQRDPAADAAFRAAAIAFVRRATFEDAKPLFDHDDLEVRGFASTALAKLNPDYAMAAFRGVQYGVATPEAFDLMGRARMPLIDAPKPAEMTDDELVARAHDVAILIFATRFFDWSGDERDPENRNRLWGEQIEVLRELKRRGALARLIPFLDDPNPVVRLEMAQACLALATEKCLAILEARVADRHTLGAELLERLEAESALKNWRNGKPVIWGVV